MLKILHLMSARHYVGEAARALDLAECQIEKGHTALVVVRRKYSVAQEANHRGIPYANAFFNSRFHPVKDVRDMRMIRRLLDEHEIDLVHAHRGKDHWLGALAVSRYRRPVPLVRTRHVVMPVRNHIANRWLYRHATHGIICVSQAVADVVAQDLTYFTGPRSMIPGGALMRRLSGDDRQSSAAMRKALHVPQDTHLVTVLARVAAVKGHIHAVDALPLVLARCPRTVFVFAYPRCSERYRAELEDRIQALGVREHVRWLGRQDRLGPLLGMTDLGLIPSVGSEGWSRVAVEFLVKGVPVVATRVGSLPEIVQDGETGRIVPPANPGALAAAVCDLLDDKDGRKAMAQRAVERRAFYSHERVTDDVLAFYEQVLEKHRARRP